MSARGVLTRLGWMVGGFALVWAVGRFTSFETPLPVIALGTIMGAAVVDLALIFRQALAPRVRDTAGDAEEESGWRRVHPGRLVLWVIVWGAATLATGHLLLGQPLRFLGLGVALVFLFAMVNGIAAGVSDSNPISSAFVVSVVVMALAGLTDPGAGLMAGAILLVSTSVACDMQQDRSTGWRLGTPRVLQFRYQVLGILVGAVLAVLFARLFLAAYPVLALDQTVMKAGQQPTEWSSAMTYKFVGVLRSLTDDKPYQRTAILVGVAIGFAIEVARKIIQPRAFWLDAIVLPSPYALSFGGFVNLPTSAWLAAGGITASVIEARATQSRELPEDMSSTSLFGGGLIAGDALAALGLGLAGLLATVF